MVAKAPKKQQKRPVSAVVESLGVEIEPNRTYSADECMQILGLKSRSTLTKYMEERAFPLRPIGEGRAYGQDVIDWMRKQKPKRRSGGYSRNKSKHRTSSVEEINPHPPAGG